MITLKDYLMGRDTTHKSELTEQIKENANKLLNKVNLLLAELGYKSCKVSSGWRPPSLNKTITNAAKASAHQTGEAIDLLEKYDLYREDGDFTKGKYTNWCHLQTRPTKSGNRIFKP